MTAIHRAPDGPSPDGSGWLGSEIADASDWVVRFDDESIDALISYARRRATQGTEAGPFVPGTAMQRSIDGVRDELLTGRGFSLLRGLPVTELGQIENEILCTTVGSLLGVPIRQNEAGDQLVRVRDEGKDFATKGVRSYETAAALPYHSDSSDVVGLYCIREAQSGGASTIISSVAVHDAIVAARPDLASILHEPWATVSVIEGTVHWKPICAANAAGRVFTRYGRMYVETAHEYDDSVEPLSAGQREALDLYDSFLADASFPLDMHFQPGDLQLLNNYRIMHARAPYVDWSDPDRRRELLRLWLVVPEMEIPTVFEDSGFVPRSEALG